MTRPPMQLRCFQEAKKLKSPDPRMLRCQEQQRNRQASKATYVGRQVSGVGVDSFPHPSQGLDPLVLPAHSGQGLDPLVLPARLLRCQHQTRMRPPDCRQTTTSLNHLDGIQSVFRALSSNQWTSHTERRVHLVHTTICLA